VTTFNQAASLEVLATDQDYAVVNTKADDHGDQKTKRVNERPDVDPFNRLVLKAATGAPVAVAPKTLIDATDKLTEAERKDKGWDQA